MIDKKIKNNTMTSSEPIFRIIKNLACMSLRLEGLDLCHICDQYRHFQMRLDGICQRSDKNRD